MLATPTQIDLHQIFQQIDEFPLLTADQEREHGWRVINDGDEEAKRLMINSNLRLVIATARRHLIPGISLTELVNEGTLGLMRAVDRYDPARGTRFSTFAAFFIRGSILDAVTEHRQNAGPLSQDDELGSERGPADIHGRLATADPLDAVIRYEQFQTLCRAIESTNERDAWMMKLRFGLVGAGHCWTAKQLAQVFGLSWQRVAKIETESLLRIRGHFRTDRALASNGATSI